MCNEIGCQSTDSSYCKLDINYGPNYGKNTDLYYRSHAMTWTFRDIMTLRYAIKCMALSQYKHQNIMIIAYPEFTKAGNIHFHGIIYEKNKLYFNKYINYWTYNYGFVKVKKIHSTLGWFCYCVKEQKLFKRRPYRITPLNYRKVLRIHNKLTLQDFGFGV